MDKIEDRAKFTYIRYANCWEDAEILCEALQAKESKRFLSIASAGDNSLSLLSYGAEVIAVDLNPSQLACVELRTVLINKLDYNDFLAFLGIKHANNRLSTFDKLKTELNGSALDFWEKHRDLIETGVIHGGKFEKYFHYFRKLVTNLIHSKKTVDELLGEKSKDERIKFYSAKWANRRWHWLFKIFCSKFVMGRMGRDPEFFRYVDIPVAENILHRVKYALTELETHQNPYLDYILTGNFTNSLPHYLKEDNFNKIKRNLNKLILYHGTIHEAAQRFGSEKYDGYNLSDIFEYLDESTCRDIYQALIEVSRPQARFAYWNMLVPRRCPKDLGDQVVYKEDLSRKLFAKDKAFFYSNFIVDELK